MSETHVMLDIETLSTAPDAAIVQIGAVKFTVDSGVETTTGLRLAIDLESANLGTIDGGTVAWWLEQDPAAIAKVLRSKPRTQLTAALSEFARWSDGAAFVWGHAPTFDCAIMRSACKRTGIKFPFTYRQERCFRTLLAIGKSMGIELPKQTGVAHDGLDDAISQATTAIAILRGIKCGV